MSLECEMRDHFRNRIRTRLGPEERPGHPKRGTISEPESGRGLAPALYKVIKELKNGTNSGPDYGLEMVPLFGMAWFIFGTSFDTYS